MIAQNGQPDFRGDVSGCYAGCRSLTSRSLCDIVLCINDKDLLHMIKKGKRVLNRACVKSIDLANYKTMIKER